ncbi:hypothetical protein H4R19_004388 [Coemansia spiralis]|nr:hypothetical protein H4R19_004388 [Coemansia spiralis]
MQPRLQAGKDAKSKREKGKRSHYDRVHDDCAESSSSGGRAAILSSVCYAAAEDDNLGWQLGDEPFDPMYTVNRREREANAAGKDLFFKKLKSRAENTAKIPAAPAPVAPTAPAATKFGFGMMGSTPPAEAALGDQAKRKKGKDKKPEKKKSRVA